MLRSLIAARSRQRRGRAGQGAAEEINFGIISTELVAT